MPKGQMSGKDPSVRAVDKAKELLKEVFAEDIWAIEKQQEMCELPDGDYREVLLKSDLALARGRKCILKKSNRNLIRTQTRVKADQNESLN